MTTTVIERMPQNWDSGDSMGDWGDDQDRVGGAWRSAFEDYLTENYEHLSLVGNEIYGPATYRFSHCDMQADTPKPEELQELPESIYAEFQELHRDDWTDVIEEYLNN